MTRFAHRLRALALPAVLCAMTASSGGSLLTASASAPGGDPRSQLPWNPLPWTVEFSQAVWAPLAAADVVGLAMAPVRASSVGIDAGPGAVPMRAYDLDAGAWWNHAVGVVVSARVIEDAVLEGPMALLADGCVGWRVARARGEDGREASVDVLAGARVAAAPADAADAGRGTDLARVESETLPVAGVRCTAGIAPGWTVRARVDAAVPIAGRGAVWSASAGVAAGLGGGWDLTLDAGWRSLDASLVEALSGDVGADGRGRGEGAVWLGLSKSF